MNSFIVSKLSKFRESLSETQKGMMLWILNFIAILMVFSRLVLGAHSINQVLYGSLLGYWTCAFVIVFLRPLMQENLKIILSRKVVPMELLFYLAIASFIYFNSWTVNFWVLFYLDYTKAFDIDFTNITKCLAEQG